MEELVLVTPTIEYKKQAINLIEEVDKTDTDPNIRFSGFAYKQLLLGLEFCKKINIKKVLVTCVEYNIGSSKTIEKAGGLLENIVFNPNKKVNEKRFWINNE